jgi:hypothetical protein
MVQAYLGIKPREAEKDDGEFDRLVSAASGPVA